MVRQERRSVQLTNHSHNYSILNNPINKDEDKDTADPQEEWPPSAIYAQVDKKSNKKEKSPPQSLTYH